MRTTELSWLLARMNVRRWVVAGLLAIMPLLVVLVLLVGVAAGAVRLAAALAATLLILGLFAVAGLLLWVRARRAKARESVEGEVVDLGRSARAESLALVDTPSARRLRSGLSFADLPHHVIAAFGMATRSPFAREQLVGVATAWQYDYAAVASTVQAATSTTELLLRDADPLALLMLARLVDSQRLEETDTVVAAALYEVVARHPRRTELSRTARQLLTERLLLSGRRDLARAVLDEARGGTLVDRLFALDVLNPFSDGVTDEPGLEGWLAGLNAMYRRVGLEPLTIAAGPEAPFDRIRSVASESRADGPLVTIIMSCYRPERAALITAVASVIAQSWTNWELLLVDDASPEEYVPLMSEVAAMDPRIRLIRSEVNRGTYLRRNDALTQARGEFVTMLDSDDWMHPRRLEIQARHLLDHPSLLANVSRSARVTPELRFAQPRGTMLRLTEASLLFRRKEVLGRVGFFDAVRKGADSTYRRRLEAEIGRPVPIVDVEAPLILARFVASSLSGDELRDGWTHPARVAYSSAASRWIATGGRYLDHPIGSRPYPAPVALGGDTPSTRLDVLYVVDPRDDPRRTRENLRFDREIAATASQLQVGVRRSECLTVPWVQHPTRPRLQDAINSGQVREVLADESISVRVAIVLDEACLLGAAGDAPPLKAERVLIVERERADGAGGVRWDRGASREGAARLFPNARVEYVALSEMASLREELIAQ